MKLRLVKKREKNEKTAVDLRGLGSESIFKNSSPFSYLLIRTESNDSNLQSLVNHYKLDCHELPQKNWHVLKSLVHSDGDHKLESITMFFAALSWNKHHPQDSYYLGQLSGLKLEYTANAADKERSLLEKEHFSNIISEQLEHLESGFIQIDEICILTLQQSGFKIPSNIKNYKLTEEFVQSLVEVSHKEKLNAKNYG